jgi:hypothetical protein
MPAKNNGHLEKRASGVDGTSLQDTSRVHLVYLTGRDFRVTRRFPRHSAFCKRAVPISWQRTTPRLVGGEGSDLIWLIWWPARLLITVAFVPPWAPPFFLPTAHAAYRQCWPLAAQACLASVGLLHALRRRLGHLARSLRHLGGHALNSYVGSAGSLTTPDFRSTGSAILAYLGLASTANPPAPTSPAERPPAPPPLRRHTQRQQRAA